MDRRRPGRPRHEVDHRGTEFKPGQAFAALAGTATWADGDGRCSQNRLCIREVPQFTGVAVDGDPALAAAVGTDHEPVASLLCRAHQIPSVSFAITDRNHAAIGDLPGVLKAAQATHALRHFVNRCAVALCRVERGIAGGGIGRAAGSEGFSLAASRRSALLACARLTTPRGLRQFSRSQSSRASACRVRPSSSAAPISQSIAAERNC